MLSLFHDNKFWPHAHDLLCCPDQIFFSGQQFGLAIVEDQTVHPFQEAYEIIACFVNPEVHGVGHHELGIFHLIEHLALHAGSGVCEENILAVLKAIRNARVEIRKDIQMDLERITIIHIRLILTSPPKRFPPFHKLESLRIDTTLTQ